jgi:hypothetical protein
VRIRIDPSHVVAIGRRLVSEAEQIAAIGRRLSGVVNGLDWESRTRIGMEDDFALARSRAEVLGRQLTGHGERLIHIAELFEQADSESAQGLDAIPWAGLTPAAGGGISGTAGRDPLQRTLAEVAFLGAFLGTAGALRVADWRAFGECLRNWLRGRGWRTDQQIRAEAERERQQSAEEERRRQEEARRRQEQQDARRREAERRREEAARAAQQPAVRYDVPPLRQKEGSYECAPTAASMLLHYYNQQNSNCRALSGQELIRELGDRFDANNGIAADELVEGLREMGLGYQTIEWQAGLNQEQLRAQLQQGPLMAQVHLNMASSGYPHMVVVTGMSDDAGRVFVNDPWTGGQSEMPWSVFERSWTFNDYPGASHLAVLIRP